MNIEKMQKMIGTADRQSDESCLFASFFMPILLIMADHYGLEDIVYDELSEEHRITMTLAMLDAETVNFMNDLSITDSFHDFCKRYYEKDMEDIINGPAKAFIGFPKHIIDHVRVDMNRKDICEAVCLINEYDEENADYASKLISGEFLLLDLSISVPKDKLLPVRNLTHERLYGYLSFLLYNWLVICTQEHKWEEYRSHMNTIISHLENMDARRDTDNASDKDTNTEAEVPEE